MSVVKIASFGYKILVVLSSTQSIYNVGSLRQVRVKNVFFVVQYLTKKRIICIVDGDASFYVLISFRPITVLGVGVYTADRLFLLQHFMCNKLNVLCDATV